MVSGSREKNILKIIEMEERICQCLRCPVAVKCTRKPSLGKGDLEPECILVFEYDSDFTRDANNIIALRNLIKSELKIASIYHSFMVRCTSKACSDRQSMNCYFEGKLINKDNTCIINNKICRGIAIRPGVEEIISCLPYLLEEINILKPRYVILFGERVTEFVLRSYGFYFDIAKNKSYKYEQMLFLTTVDESEFQVNSCNDLVALL